MRLSRRKWLARLVTGLALFGCTSKPNQSQNSPVSPALSPEKLRTAAEKRQNFRRGQDARMRSALSPLARVDYQHIPIGQHPVGLEVSSPLHLFASLRSGFGGQLVVSRLGSEVTFSATETVLYNGQPANRATLRKGDVLTLGQTQLLLTGSLDDPGFGIYSDQAEAKRTYSGLHDYPDDEAFVVEAKLFRTAPHPVKVLASRGEPQELISVGDLHFSLPDGEQRRDCTLEAYLETPGGKTLFLIFRDKTSGKPSGSYGAGRFLLADLDPSDTAILDFNQAWNPLCAYSPYFHCPMPSQKNHIPVAITAGEKAYGDH